MYLHKSDILGILWPFSETIDEWTFILHCNKVEKLKNSKKTNDIKQNFDWLPINKMKIHIKTLVKIRNKGNY